MFGRRRLVFALFVLFVTLYSIARVGVWWAIQTGAIDPGTFVEPRIKAIIEWSQLAIGLAGLLAIFAMAAKRDWGTTLTAGVAFYTVVFDLWAVTEGFPSAVFGVVPATVILLYIAAPRFTQAMAQPSV